MDLNDVLFVVYLFADWEAELTGFSLGLREEHGLGVELLRAGAL